MQSFISFLGQIGIDIQLLIAQIINFGILLWILTKFVYHPIIKKIEEDEKELLAAKTAKEKLEKEKASYEKQKNTEIRELKETSRKKIEKAEEMAKQIKKEATIKAEKEADAIVSRMKKTLKSKKAGMINEQIKKIRDEMLENIINIAKQILFSTKSIKVATQKYFFKNFEEKLNKFPDEVFKGKTPSVTLVTPFPVEKDERENIKEMLKEKFGSEIEFSEKINKELISGYRLEINGLAAEDNLINKLRNAIQIK